MRQHVPLFLLPALAAFALSLGGGQEASAGPITLAIEPAQGTAGGRVKVPCVVEDADQLGPVQLEVAFDPTVLQVSEVKAGSLARSAMVHHETPEPGTLRLALITTKAISGDGDLIDIEFTVIGRPNQSSEIRIPYAQAWEWESLAELLVDTRDGTFTVSRSGWPLNLTVAIAVVLLILLIAVVIARRRKVRSGSPA